MTNLAAARHRLIEAEAGIEKATSRVAVIESGFRTGTSEHTDAEHAAAMSGVRRAELAQDGATAEVRRLEQKPKNTDTTLAQAVAALAQKALPGVPVVTTFATGVNDRPRPVELPLLLIVQSDPCGHAPDGRLSGTVDLTFYRGEIHKPLNPWVFEDAARDLDFRVSVGSVTSGGTSTSDRLRITVQRAHLPVPIVEAIGEGAGDVVAGKLATGIAAGLKSQSESIRQDVNSGAFVTSFVSSLPHGSKVVECVEENGERVLTLDASVIVQTHQLAAWTTLREEANHICLGLVGRFFAGLGVVESAEIVTGSELSIADEATMLKALRGKPTGYAPARDLPVDAASIGWETLDSLVVRVTVRSALAPSQIAA